MPVGFFEVTRRIVGSVYFLFIVLLALINCFSLSCLVFLGNEYVFDGTLLDEKLYIFVSMYVILIIGTRQLDRG